MRKLAAGFALLAGLVVLFQNCGKAGFEDQNLYSDEASSQSLDPKLAGLPFPYDISVNQIAHMSCPMKVSGTTSPYFTWKIGAFENPSESPTAALNIRPAGLKISTDFQTAWGKTETAFSPAKRTEKFKEALTGLASVAGTQLQLSFRKVNVPQFEIAQMPLGGDAPVTNFAPLVSSAQMVDAFVENPTQTLQQFPSETLSFLEVGLNVPSSLAEEPTMRAIYDSSFLTLGFLKPGAEGQPAKELSGPESNGRYAYGKGYRIHFSATNARQTASGMTSLYPASDSLNTVIEHDLETGTQTPGVGWDCSYKFKIVKAADRYRPVYRQNHFYKPGGACPTAEVIGDYCASPIDPSFGLHPNAFGGQCPANRPLVFNARHCEEHYAATCPNEPYTINTNNPNPIQRDEGVYPNPQRIALLQALRRFLPVNQWDINISRRCIVPKVDDNSCYSESSKIVYNDFFFPDPGTANPAVEQYVGCGVAGQFQCAGYLTLCLRR